MSEENECYFELDTAGVNVSGQGFQQLVLRDMHISTPPGKPWLRLEQYEPGRYVLQVGDDLYEIEPLGDGKASLVGETGRKEPT